MPTMNKPVKGGKPISQKLANEQGFGDLTIETDRSTSAEAINEAFARMADRDRLKGILAYTADPIVSSDIVGSSYSAIFDSALTAVVDGTQVKVVAWYDNEWGYSTRLVELAEKVMVPVAAQAA